MLLVLLLPSRQEAFHIISLQRRKYGVEAKTRARERQHPHHCRAFFSRCSPCFKPLQTVRGEVEICRHYLPQHAAQEKGGFLFHRQMIGKWFP